MINDIINQLASQLPIYTNVFSDTLTWSSISVTGGVATVTTPYANGLINNSKIAVNGMDFALNISSLNCANNIATVVTETPHDLTENWQENVVMEGFNQSVFNGTFTLLTVPDRWTFTCTIPGSPPSTGSGALPQLIEHLSYGLDGTYSITTTSPTTFTFNIENTTLTGNGLNGIIWIGQRVMPAANIERAVALYTEHKEENAWAFVCMTDATNSKSRDLINDAVMMGGPTVDLRSYLIEPFDVFVIIPAKNDIAAGQAIQLIYSAIKPAMFQSLIGFQLPSYTACESTGGIQFVAHGMNDYNKAFYIHQFRFEISSEILIEDSIFNGDGTNQPTVAFRDIYLDMFPNTVTNGMNIDIDLDQDAPDY